MLPQIGTTLNFTLDGSFNTMHISGVYAIQAVTDDNMKTTVGYRNWQSYAGDFSGIFYGVSYLNGSYIQALIDPNTSECINVFVEIVNCTSWLNTKIINWDNRCSIARVDPVITDDMSLNLITSASDLMSPVNFSAVVHIPGVPDSTMTYKFLSKTEQTSFPYVKCYF